MHKTALITGICGQDGSFLADLLLEKGYRVFGFKRRTSSNSLGCASHLEFDVEFVEGDVTDPASLNRLCSLARADEFYNLAGQSHVGSSFSQPAYTLEVNGKGVLNCLEAIRQSGIHTRFYQASTSEMFGGDLVDGAVQVADERSPFCTKSPYAEAKAYGHNITRIYRESYKMFACCGLLFNHESERRGPNFVTRKITLAVAAIKNSQQAKLKLGNLDMARDWGYAPDYVRGMHLMLNHHEPRDFVLATGETHSVREFADAAFRCVGLDYTNYVEIDPQLFRPNEVPALCGRAGLAYNLLGWKPTVGFAELVSKMVRADLAN